MSAFHLPGPEVTLAGFVLRAWSADDVPDMVAAWQDPEMHRWIPEEADPLGTAEATTDVENAAEQLAEGRAIAIAIADAGTDRVVGSLSFQVWAPGHWNVGYWVAPEARKRGLATAALTTLSRWAFSAHLELERLSLYTLPGNDASARVAERAGFQREGVLRRWAEGRGRRRDWVMYSLIRDDLAAG